MVMMGGGWRVEGQTLVVLDLASDHYKVGRKLSQVLKLKIIKLLN